MRRSGASLALAAALAVPALTAPSVGPPPDPAPASSAGQAWAQTTPAGAVASRTGRPVPVPAADPGSELPQPPAVDMRRLPSDSQPTALAGLRQVNLCVTPDKAPAPPVTALPTLLWGQRLLTLPELWTRSRGAKVRIAVIDSGVARHPLLGTRLVPGGDYVAGGNGLSDCDGHGTAVAGIAAAAVDAGTGFAGVAPQAEVIAIRQSSASFATISPNGTERTAGDTDTLARSILHAVELGADVINISQVSCVPPEKAAVAGPPLQAAIRYAAQRDVVIVVAAGNRGGGATTNATSSSCPAQSDASTIVLPAWYDGDVLAVTSSGPDGTASQFSLRGPWVDVAAPGEDIVSLSAAGPGLTHKSSTPGVLMDLQGTSFAAPAVAGLAALIRARHPQLTAKQVMDRITATATQPTAGRNTALGYGVINAEQALTRTPAVLDPPDSDDDRVLAGIGELPLSPVAHPDPAGPVAIWGGVLALLAAVTAAGLAVTRLRDRRPRGRW